MFQWQLEVIVMNWVCESTKIARLYPYTKFMTDLLNVDLIFR